MAVPSATTKTSFLPGTSPSNFDCFELRLTLRVIFRLIASARVIDSQICYDHKDANQIYELCHTRFSLHKRIYNHKTGNPGLVSLNES
jgi:hypothetical protein